MIGIKGLIYYQDYSISINYYEEDEYLLTTNNSDCYRLLFIEEGAGTIEINQNSIPVFPFTLMCLKEKDVVSNINMTGNKFHLLCFQPSAINSKLTFEIIKSIDGLTISDTQDLQFILPFLDENKEKVNTIILQMDTGYRIKHILKNLKEQMFVQNDSWPCLTRSYLIELLFLVERTFSQERTDRNSISEVYVDDIITYIHNNYSKRLTIDELAKKFKTNRTTLSKEFKKVTDHTIVDYILKTRVQVAMGMLRDTSMNVAIIAERVGFNNITHFNKVFTKNTGCLPHEYRKKVMMN